VWCAMALGLADARDLVRRGLVTKDGGPAAMDHYFDQIDRAEEGPRAEAEPEAEPAVKTEAETPGRKTRS